MVQRFLPPCFMILPRGLFMPRRGPNGTLHWITVLQHRNRGPSRFPNFSIMSYLLPHLRSGWAVDQAILNEEDRVVVIRFGHDWVCFNLGILLFWTSYVFFRTQHVCKWTKYCVTSLKMSKILQLYIVLVMSLFPSLSSPSDTSSFFRYYRGSWFQHNVWTIWSLHCYVLFPEQAYHDWSRNRK